VTDFPPIEASHYRTTLGHFATGVTIITAMLDGKPVGMAANSFSSVSLDPPLVVFCAAHSSSTWPHIQQAGAWCVNVLSEDQEDLCRLFATKDVDRFAQVGWRKAPSGSPILEGVLAHIDCRTDAEYEAGDHVLVVGRVLELEVHHEGGPLTFFRGGYGRLDR
jgi:3-hydroxy-9,10-secoandrosta-1,3,5(10)-triene-9,17-dione monooxygenase reductase component